MYYKINKTGCSEVKGLVEIRYDLFLDPEDDGYSEHHITDADTNEESDNPFCCHFYQFEADATDEYILSKGDDILRMAFSNWLTRELHKNVNDSRPFISRDVYNTVKPILKAEKVSVELVDQKRKEIEPIGSVELPIHIEEGLNKVRDAESRIDQVMQTEFYILEEASKYKIRR